MARFTLNFCISLIILALADIQRFSNFILLGTKRKSALSVSSGVGLAHSVIIGVRLALPLHASVIRTRLSMLHGAISVFYLRTTSSAQQNFPDMINRTI